jgi:membrane AbrB-like protein
MSEFSNVRGRMPAILKALAVGIPAGYLFDLLSIPIPWMIGPMIAAAAVNLMGVRVQSPPYARQIGQVILGSAVSLYFTPTVVAALVSNLPAIAAATVSVFLIGGLGALTLSRASGLEGKSTFFASIPGGAMAMAVLAERYGAQIAPVAVAHSLRVSILVILIPLALTYGGFPLEAAPYRPDVPLNYSILIPWLAFGFVLGEISERLRLQNGYLLAPIFFGAALTVSGVQLSAVPRWMTEFAQLMFGLVLAALRARFLRPLQAVYSVCPAEFVFYSDRLGSDGCGSGFDLRSSFGDDDHSHRSRWVGGDDDYRTGSADQRAAGGRVPPVPRGGGQYGHAVYLRLRRENLGRKS